MRIEAVLTLLSLACFAKAGLRAPREDLPATDGSPVSDDTPAVQVYQPPDEQIRVINEELDKLSPEVLEDVFMQNISSLNLEEPRTLDSSSVVDLKQSHKENTTSLEDKAIAEADRVSQNESLPVLPNTVPGEDFSSLQGILQSVEERLQSMEAKLSMLINLMQKNPEVKDGSVESTGKNKIQSSDQSPTASKSVKPTAAKPN